MSVKVTVAVRWSVVDPVAYTSAMDAEGVVYLGVQVALREQLAGQDASELVRTGRRATTDALLDAARLAAAEVGIDVVAVVIKDIMLPRRPAGRVLRAGCEPAAGPAQLEVARAESAALRSMANAARLLDQHPALARLRLVQAAAYGSKLILDVPDRPAEG